LNVPYEFFLVSGAKMSSSKGVGTAAREMANFLPPEILRFLMIQTPPKRTVNFSTDFDHIVKLFNEHDRLVESVYSGRATLQQQKTLSTIEVDPQSTAYHPVGFQLLTALLQLPHIEVEAELEKRTPGGLTELDQQLLRKRLKSSQYWLENYASEADRVVLQETLPVAAEQLSATQKAFLRLLGENFPEAALTDEEYQRYIFDTARITPISQKEAFAAIYRVLLDQDKGPKAGSLLVFLERDFLLRRFAEITFSQQQYWRETALSETAFLDWVNQQRAQIRKLQATVSMAETEGSDPAIPEVVECRFTMEDGKIHALRVLPTPPEDGAGFLHHHQAGLGFPS
jgi:lysyl-tRNA synthetase class 1